jgi:hypothetical protein
MYSDEIRSRDHLNIIGATPAHPAVGHADDRDPVGLRLLDDSPSGMVHHQHADIIATVVVDRDVGLPQHLQRIARALEAPVLGNVEDLREPRILVTAQRRIDHMIGDDSRFLRVIANATAHARNARAPH